MKSSFVMSCLGVVVLAGCGSDSGRGSVDSGAPDGMGGAGGDVADSPRGGDSGMAIDVPSVDVPSASTGGSGGSDARALVDGGTGGVGSGGAGGGGTVGVDASIGSGGSGGATEKGGRDGGEGDRGQGGLATGGAGGTSGGGAGGGLDGGGVGGAGGANCGSLTFEAAHLPADLLLVVDRSASMAYSIAEDCLCTPSSSATRVCPDTANCTPRWTALVAAVNAAMGSASAINWGLKLFTSPGGSTCSVSAGVEVPVSAASTAAIQAQLASVALSNNTPTAAAIKAATAYLNTVTDGNGRAILLATDGEPNCANGSASSSDVVGTVAAISAARSAGFAVYVVGIGPSVGNLDNFAQAGGTGNHFPATSPEDLTTALRTVSTATTSCAFTLPTVPPDPNNVGIYLDKSLVPRDSSNGWTFGASPQTIVFVGQSCSRVTSAVAARVQALFGCPGVALPPALP